MGLEKVMVSMLSGVVKSSLKLDESLDNFTEKASSRDTSLGELGGVVQAYNAMKDTSTQIQTVIEPLSTFETSMETIVTTVETAQNVIKAIPLPTSTPPGTGIPVNVLTIYSDVLDKLMILLKKGKNLGEGMGEVLGIIGGYFNTTNGKVRKLNSSINTKLDRLALEEARETNPTPTPQQVLAIKFDMANQIDYPIQYGQG